MSKQKNSLYFHRLSLIHQTDRQAAELIIQSQFMKPGVGGLYGPGIYFANTIEACKVKALRKGVFLIADVYLGKTCSISKDEAMKIHLDKDPEVSKKIQKEGFTAICGYKQLTGREFIVFDPERVKNIKFIYGDRPQSIPNISHKRLVLFWVTDHNTAKQIVESQNLPQYNGPFGNGFYLFDSITDAISHLGNNETFLAADFSLKSFGELRPNQTLDSPKLPKHFQTFLGKSNNLKFYISKDPSMIKNIHYCGGKLFEE